MMRLLIVQLVACLALTGVARDGPAAEPSQPHIIMITIDTLRTDALSCMGCQRRTTPFLDSLAARGTLFSNAYSTSSWTVPAVASLLTSLYPSAHGVTSGDIETASGKKTTHNQQMLSATLVTLAEMLRAAGYRTVGVAANRHLQDGTGFEQGFDYYYQTADFCSAERTNKEVRRLLRAMAGEEWSEHWKDRPTFLWVHYFDPHHFYTPRRPWIIEYAPDFASTPEAFPSRVEAEDLNASFDPADTEMVRRVTALYHSEVRYTDEHIRRLLAELDPGDDTLIVISSDHGEELGERSAFGHRETLFDEVCKVPLLISRPAVLPQGQRLDTLVSILDILPTIAEVAGCPSPEGIHGRSLLPLLGGSDTSDKDGAVLLELHPPYGDGGLRALVRDHRKLVRPFDNQGRPALYDLDADPNERTDLGRRKRATVRRLGRQLDRILESLPEPPPLQIFSVDDEEDLEQLRALGYVD